MRNVLLKWKVIDLSVQLVYAMPYLSVIAETLSHFLNTSPTPFAVAVFYPLLFVILPVLLTHRISASVLVLLGFYFSFWSLIVLLLMSPLNSDSLFRFTSMLWQVALMIFVATVLDKKHVFVSKVFLNYGVSCATIVALSNLLYPSLGFSLSYFAFERYKGLFGPNAHGLTSAIAAISFISYASGSSHSRASQLFFAAVIFWLLANVWASGSRLSVVTVVAFLVIFFNKRLLGYLILAAIALTGLVVYSMLPNKETALALLRFDEYSLWGRLNPPLWGWQMARAHYFQPYGFTTLREDILEQRLDNSFLILLLEVGSLGFGLMIGIIFVTLYRCHILEKHLQNPEANNVRAIRAILVALCLHGLGENSLFTSSNIATVLFLTLIGATHAIYKSTPAIRHHRLSGRRGGDAAGAHR